MVATSDDNCVLFWGTRLGIPETDINASLENASNNNHPNRVKDNNTQYFVSVYVGHWLIRNLFYLSYFEFIF